MAEYCVNVHLESETDIEINFSKWTNRQIAEFIFIIKTKGKYTFKDIYVELEGETYVEIEPQDRY